MTRDPWFFSRWAHEQRVGHPARKLILTALAMMAESNTGWCFATRVQLAEFAEVTDRTVYEHVKALEKAGLIARRTGKPQAGGQRGATEFLLLADGVECWPDGAPIHAEESSGRPTEPAGNHAEGQGFLPTHQRPDSTEKSSEGNPQNVNGSLSESEQERDARELPEMLLDAWEVDVMRVLLALPRTTGSPVPTVGALRRVRSDFPELDLLVVARELDFWARHGNGSRRQIKSVMGTFRNFAKRAEEDRQRRAASSSPSAAVPSVAARQDEGWERAPWT